MASKISPTALALQQKYAEDHGLLKVKVVKSKKSKTRILEKPNVTTVETGLTGNTKDWENYIRNINKSLSTGIVKNNRMDDVEIIRKLIFVYDEALRDAESMEYKKDTVWLKKYLQSKNCHVGICNLSYVTTGVDITEKEWIIEYNIEIRRYGSSLCEQAWCEFPFRMFNYDDILKSLQFRLNKLKEILNSFYDAN